MHILTHERDPCTQTLELKTVAIVTRDGKRAWRRTGVSKGVLRACLSLSSCQHVLRACHGESGGRTKVSVKTVRRACQPSTVCSTKSNTLITHWSGNMEPAKETCETPWGHPEGITPSAEATSDWIQKIFISVSCIEIWNGSLQQDFLEITADVIPVVKMP